MRPLAIDLFCGLGGWAEGLLSEGYDVIGFDVEAHDYGTGGYPGQLVLQDVTTLHGSQFRNATLIVASPPCQAYSYRAMPWKRAKALPPPDNTLFEACFRIQREASEAAGRHIPMVVENVRGAERWVGRAGWHYGSYYLWGDIPALMVPTSKATKVGGLHWNGYGEPGYKPQGFNVTAAQRYREEEGRKVDGYSDPRRNGGKGAHLTSQRENADGLKFGGDWRHDSTNNLLRKASSKSNSRKAASAQIAKIPFPLAQHIARVYKPQ